MSIPSPSGWQVSDLPPPWRSGEVHVWIAQLDVDGRALNAFEQLLSPDERTRAGRFLVTDERLRFVATRAQLRQLLADYLGRDPHELVIRQGPFGKPYLADTADTADAQVLYFNVSHCGDFALYALSFEMEVGIDLASIDELNQFDTLGQYFLTEGERQALGVLPEVPRHIAHFRHWARKEAYVKARGCGLSMDPRSFSVLSVPGEPVRIDESGQDGRPAMSWSIVDLDLGLPYLGAVAAPGDWQLRCWRYRLPKLEGQTVAANASAP